MLAEYNAVDLQIFLAGEQVLTGGFDHAKSAATAVVDYQQVFVYDLVANSSGRFVASDPGFNATRDALPATWRLELDVRSGLRFWNGTGTPAFQPVSGGVEVNLNAFTRHVRVGAGGASEPLVVQTVPTSGELHYHATSNIGVGGSGQSFVTHGAPDGIYMFEAVTRLLPPTNNSSGLPAKQASLPVHVLYSVDQAARAGWAEVKQRARDHFRDLAIGTATFALAVDDGASPTDGVSTNGTVNVGGLNPRATREFSINGGATWAPLGADPRLVLPRGSYPEGAIRVRQRVTDHYGERTVIGASARSIAIVAPGDPTPPTPTPPTPTPPTPTPPTPTPPTPTPPTPTPPTPTPPTPTPPTPTPPTPTPPTPTPPTPTPPTPTPPTPTPTPPPVVRPPVSGAPIVLRPVRIQPPVSRGGMVEIPLDLSGLSAPPDRVGIEHLALSRAGRRVSLSGARVAALPEGGFALVLPRKSIAGRDTYRLQIGGTGTNLLAGSVPIREVATLLWRSPPPSPQLIAALRGLLNRGRNAPRGPAGG